MGNSKRPRERGQILVAFGAVSIVFLVVTALVVDGGFAFAQRRSAQNAADLAALAAVRIIASGGTDADVKNNITSTAQANKGTVTFAPINQGPPTANAQYPTYLDASSAPLGWVGRAPIPSGSVGVRVPASITWNTFLARIVQINTWTASTVATARLRSPTANGGVFPFGISQASFDQSVSGHFIMCPADQEPVLRGGTCPDQLLTEDDTGIPGGFGWLKFGAIGKCDGFGLGMSTTDGCDNNAGALQREINGLTYGCCDAPTGGAAPVDRIGSLPGKNGQGGDNCSVPINSEQTYIIPVWDDSGKDGGSKWYHIVGFAGFQVTVCDGGNSAKGVWRLPVWPGPTNQIPIPPGAAFSVQLLK